MATQHVSATISGQASAAIFGQTFAEAIRDNLSAHAAWELVEEYDPGSVVKHYVFKCLSTSSGLPADFFLVMTRVLSTGVLQFYIGEGYNSGTHVLSLFPTGNSSGISNTSTYA